MWGEVGGNSLALVLAHPALAPLRSRGVGGGGRDGWAGVNDLALVPVDPALASNAGRCGEGDGPAVYYEDLVVPHP